MEKTHNLAQTVLRSGEANNANIFTNYSDIYGILGITISTYAALSYNLFAGDSVKLTILVSLALFLFVAIRDLGVNKVHRSPSAGLDFNRKDFSYRRVATKLIGILFSYILVAFMYWFFAEYNKEFYSRFYIAIYYVLPVVALITIPYVAYIDMCMLEPHDGFWHFGSLVYFRIKSINYSKIRQHLLGLLVKGFFLPLMFLIMCDDIQWLQRHPIIAISHFGEFYDYCLSYLYFIDVAYAVAGYSFSLTLLNSHVKSVEDSFFGWSIALICYTPFSQNVLENFIGKYDIYRWDWWIGGYNNYSLFVAWGMLNILLAVIYVWATVVFGIRFSNLTNRGVITHGPYRWTKHPAYIAKNLSFWLVNVPFVVNSSFLDSLKACLCLIVVNYIYYLRAKTEERHLLKDPEYVAYSKWIDERGIFSKNKFI